MTGADEKRHMEHCGFRKPVLFLALLPMSLPTAAQNDLHYMDFKDFVYPMSGSILGHNRLVWLDENAHGWTVRLRKGVGHGRSEGFSLRSVTFGDVTGDRKEDAIVVLHYRTGGTQETDYIYIFSFAASGPKLLAYCYTGDRAASGLNKAYADRGELVVELFDPEKQAGDCCSTGIVRTRYRWRSDRFEPAGRIERQNIGKPQTGP